jgi:hypothetical protein
MDTINPTLKVPHAQSLLERLTAGFGIQIASKIDSWCSQLVLRIFPKKKMFYGNFPENVQKVEKYQMCWRFSGNFLQFFQLEIFHPQHYNSQLFRVFKKKYTI